MNAEQLKNSILQRAVEGKLVEQREEEGTAAELLREIKAEKARLVKEGKIKKEKPLRSIKAEEIPFEIPESWEWVRLGEILNSLTDGTHKTPKYTASGVPFLSVKNISSRSLSFENTKFISQKEHEELTKRCHPQKGDMLLSKVGTTGIPVIIDTDKDFSIFVSIALLKYSSYIYAPYLLRAIESPHVQEQCKLHTRGVGNKNWVLNDIANTTLPLPPLAEQKRIVAKIEELLPHVEQYGKAHDELTALNEKFPDAMKKSVLQYAMKGKLVEQREEEGTAKELLSAIKAEKARLVVEGKLKKEKPLPEIKAEELPFEIPESWEWVRLRDIVYNRGQEKPSEDFVYIDIGSIDNKRQQLGEKETIIAPDKAPSRARKIVDCGDIIYSTVRPYLHNICIIDKHFSRPPIASTGFAVMTTYQGVLNKYLFHYLLSPQFDSYANSNQNAKGVAYPAINDKAFYSAPVPLPPLAEQKRIVAKIEELLACCGELGNETTA